MGEHDKRDPKRTSTDRTDSASDPAAAPPAEPDPKAGIDREVGDLDDPDAVQDDGALPGRAGGGLAGG